MQVTVKFYQSNEVVMICFQHRKSGEKMFLVSATSGVSFKFPT